MRDLKQALKDSIRKQEKFENRYDVIEKAKKKGLDALAKRPEFTSLTVKERKENPAYAEAAAAIADKHSKELEDLRYKLEELFEEQRRKNLPDYEIFMAIAEDIGYDATNRTTKTNELDFIGPELQRFIENIEGKSS